MGLTSVTVGKGVPVMAAPLQSDLRASLVSNALIDSGSDHLRLAGDLYPAVLAGFNAANPAFGPVVQKAITDGSVAMTSLDIAAWPDIVFSLSGVAEEAVALTVTPLTYWQTDSPVPGKASFRIAGPLSEANQSNLGLPLLNNYFTVFDRAAAGQGVIRFAPIKLSIS